MTVNRIRLGQNDEIKRMIKMEGDWFLNEILVHRNQTNCKSHNCEIITKTHINPNSRPLSLD